MISRRETTASTWVVKRSEVGQPPERRRNLSLLGMRAARALLSDPQGSPEHAWASSAVGGRMGCCKQGHFEHAGAQPTAHDLEHLAPLDAPRRQLLDELLNAAVE